jgi:hypothetical protein
MFLASVRMIPKLNNNGCGIILRHFQKRLSRLIIVVGTYGAIHFALFVPKLRSRGIAETPAD